MTFPLTLIVFDFCINLKLSRCSKTHSWAAKTSLVSTSSNFDPSAVRKIPKIVKLKIDLNWKTLRYFTGSRKPRELGHRRWNSQNNFPHYHWERKKLVFNLNWHFALPELNKLFNPLSAILNRKLKWEISWAIAFNKNFAFICSKVVQVSDRN